MRTFNVAGTPVDALSNEAHIPHLRRHMEWLAQTANQIESGAVDIVQVVEPMFRVHAHATQHVVMGGADPAITQAVAGFRQQLQQYGEFIYNGQEKLRKLQKLQAEQGVAEANQPTGLSPEMEKKLAEHNLQLKMEQEKHELKMRLQVAEANQKRMLVDADARAKQARLGILP